MERVSIIAMYKVDVWFCELRNGLIYHHPRMVGYQARDNHRLPSISATLTASGTLTLEAPDFIYRFIKCELRYHPFISYILFTNIKECQRLRSLANSIPNTILLSILPSAVLLQGGFLVLASELSLSSTSSPIPLGQPCISSFSS